MTSAPRTLYDKLWDAHVVVPESNSAPAVLYIDLHLIHEVTSPQAFTELRSRGLAPRRPDRTKATMDHSTPTLPAGADGKLPYASAAATGWVASGRSPLRSARRPCWHAAMRWCATRTACCCGRLQRRGRA